MFLEIRKRLGLDYWNEINELIVKHNLPNEKDDDNLPKNEGILNVDASIVEQDIQYTTDLGILNESREKLEDLVDLICSKTGQVKPCFL